MTEPPINAGEVLGEFAPDLHALRKAIGLQLQSAAALFGRDAVVDIFKADAGEAFDETIPLHIGSVFRAKFQDATAARINNLLDQS